MLSCFFNAVIIISLVIIPSLSTFISSFSIVTTVEGIPISVKPPLMMISILSPNSLITSSALLRLLLPEMFAEVVANGPIA